MKQPCRFTHEYVTLLSSIVSFGRSEWPQTPSFQTWEQYSHCSENKCAKAGSANRTRIGYEVFGSGTSSCWFTDSQWRTDGQCFIRDRYIDTNRVRMQRGEQIRREDERQEMKLSIYRTFTVDPLEKANDWKNDDFCQLVNGFQPRLTVYCKLFWCCYYLVRLARCVVVALCWYKH